MSKRGDPLDWLLGHLSYSGQDCLAWPFSRRKDGYGICWTGGKRFRAHRLMCEGVHGLSPEKGYEAAHSCGNGHLGCVNPNHLEWKTPKQNQADRLIHGTDSRGEKQGAAKLSADLVLQKRASRVIEYARGKAVRDGKQHPTQKPIEVMVYCLQELPAKTKTILDPFAGSGTTGVACVKQDLAFTGIEIDEGYFDIACRRIQDAYDRPDMFVQPRAPEPVQEALL